MFDSGKYEYDNMQDSLSTYNSIRSYVVKEISTVTQREGANSQYRLASTSNHTHNGLDAPQIPYGNILGVQGYLISLTTILSSAQVKALHTTPIVLVPPPTSTRSFIFVDGVAGRLSYAGTAYTGTNNLEFRYTSASGLKVCADMPAAVFLNATASALSYSPWQVDYSRTVDSNFTPVGGGSGPNGQIVVSVPTANPATGNSPITLIVYYRTISFST